MRRKYPGVPFERYADDIIVHCKTETEAKQLKAVLGERLKQCKLELHARRPRLFTVRMTDGVARTQMRSLIFWDLLFVHG
jgi:hypothetical protein